MLLLLQLLLELRVLNGVVAEVEPFGEVNGVAHPLGEVSVADLALLAAVLVLDQLFEVVVVKVLLLAEVAQDVLDRDVAVVVSVQR